MREQEEEDSYEEETRAGKTVGPPVPHPDEKEAHSH